MLEYGYTSYNMSVGEHLGHLELEKGQTLSLEEAPTAPLIIPTA
jgi:hypothetical protein